MKLDYFQVDAFAERPFEGNPAGVCPLDAWLDDDLMQAVAEENNLAETAFFVREADTYRIRWFTPVTEVDLCGHATLASAHVLFTELDYAGNEVTFRSRSGDLRVKPVAAGYSMDFPLQMPRACDPPEGLLPALSLSQSSEITFCGFNEDLFVVLQNEQVLRQLKPDFAALNQLDARGVIVTSTAKNYDFVCRFFAPQVGINEDPVTGSAFTKLTPFWAERLGRTSLRAKQVSSRGGLVACAVRDGRVSISGAAVCVLRGQLQV